MGYGWTGCIDATHTFDRPPEMNRDYGEPLGFCSETAPGSGVWKRPFTKADITMDCASFTATFDMHEERR